VRRFLRRGRRNAHTFIGDDCGRGITRGYIRSHAGCDLAAKSWLGKFQHRCQLDARHGADWDRVLRGIEHYGSDDFNSDNCRRIYLQCRSTGLFVRLCCVKYPDIHWGWHQQCFFKCPEFSPEYHLAIIVPQW